MILIRKRDKRRWMKLGNNLLQVGEFRQIHYRPADGIVHRIAGRGGQVDIDRRAGQDIGKQRVGRHQAEIHLIA